MKQFISSLLLVLGFSLITQAQTPQRVYRTGDYIAIRDTATTAVPKLYPASQVAVYPSGGVIIVESPIFRLNQSYLPANFLNASNVAYGGSLSVAIAGWQSSLAGNIGTVAPTVANYTSTSVTVPVANAVKLILENTGTTSVTYTYGGAGNVSTLAVGASPVVFEAERDPTTGLLSPILSLAIMPGSYNARIRTYYKQL
ncbi:hypothetical protein [Spirosoma litoris]